MLKLSTVPQRDKLRLEFQLIQVKRLLLRDQNLKSCQLTQCNLAAFEKLEVRLREVIEAELLGPALDHLSQELEEMLVVLWAVDKIYADCSGVYFNNSPSGHPSR
ncbi:hypothetical protein M1B72_08800 [Geomonas paludis]|uniref:Uncharacterized protein n=1 Tax=Geomonas paludis TaxID=2740185 RepID=A0A6V8MWM5_9BACT|nr:hypothetical protein [Geomonas paludis]UPU37789.1 hypothetical protein M1B72_08800 [Geomonas paludis]GFO63669.1 hypothetical protein GMPD_15880 [Geomonas paludis]